MEKKYYLGKVDGYGNGRKSCKAFITWELEEKEKGFIFSACGEVWNSRETDLLMGGQCVDYVAALVPGDKKAARIVEIWKRWHLNDTRAGCEHQRAEKWNEKRINPAELPESNHHNRDEKGVIATWVKESEHKDGLLMKPCPICGYKYGSQWLFEYIPDDIIEEIEYLSSLCS